MPIYEYECTTCGVSFECHRKMTDPSLGRKPGCENQKCSPRKLISRFFGQRITSSTHSRIDALETKISKMKDQKDDSTHVCSHTCDFH